MTYTWSSTMVFNARVSGSGQSHKESLGKAEEISLVDMTVSACVRGFVVRLFYTMGSYQYKFAFGPSLHLRLRRFKLDNGPR